MGIRIVCETDSEGGEIVAKLVAEVMVAAEIVLMIVTADMESG